MDPPKSFSSLPNLSKNFNNVYDKVSETRKNLVQLHQFSCKSNDNLNTSYLLDRELQKYTDIVTSNTDENIYQNKLKKVLNKYNINERPKFQFNFNDFDIDSTFPKEPSFNKFSCNKCEKYNESEFESFRKCFVSNSDEVTRKVSKGIHKLQNCGSSKLVRSHSTKSSDNLENEFENALHGHFKTAREVLEIQTAKKIGNSNTNSTNFGLNSATAKKKLGIRRTVTSKFVSPLLTNNSTEEAVKSEEFSGEEIDERLKNIDPKMVELIKSEIMDCGPNIHWDDIAGLQFAKTAIQEAVVWPMLRPDIFTGLRRPPKGILLFGPPGTGKTLIGKCVASQSKSTFFSISASSLTSKWVGDGEKMVRALFSVARVHQPAVIFIDEIDSLLSQRSDTEHESSRRIKTEFLVQLDGATTDSEERILVIGATNRPQELDEAARRRFVKRLYIPLPDFDARLQLLQKLIENENHEISKSNFEEIAKLSDGYSGADIRNLCAEASLGPIRSIDMSMMEKIRVNDVRPLIMDDFKKAFNRIRSSVSSNDLNQYIAWDKTYGSGL